MAAGLERAVDIEIQLASQVAVDSSDLSKRR